jgi:hypothetical protein
MPTREEFQRATASVSPASRRLNPDLFGAAPGVAADPAPRLDERPGTLVRRPAAQEGRTTVGAGGTRFRCSLVAFTRHDVDPDNLGAALKHVQDVVAELLGVDDGDRRRVLWQYGNVVTRGRQGVLVQIEEEARTPSVAGRGAA